MKKMILALLLLVVFSVPAVFAQDNIKLGLIVPLTGNMAYWGENVLMGSQLAIEEINNQGGVLGKKLELNYMDFAGDKAQAVTATRKYIQEGVTVLIGPPVSGIMLATGPLANTARLPYISAGATNPEVGKIGPYVFKNALDDAMGAPLMVQYAKSKGVKKVVLLYSNNNDYAVAMSKLFEAAMKKQNVQILDKITFSDGETDFSAQVTKIKSLAPDAIFFGGYAPECALILRQARKTGVTIPVFSGDAIYDRELFELGGNAAEGTTLYTGYSATSGAKKTKDFIAAFNKKFKKDPQLNSAIAYDTVYIIAEALRGANSLDKEKIRDAVSNIKNFDGVSGKTTFTKKDGNAIKPAYIETIKGGKFVFVDVLQ